ncbi:MAG TPA: hypothetical protein VGK02_04680 [Candidatus Aquicultor sp.]|jgi:hypothetical protein
MSSTVIDDSLKAFVRSYVNSLVAWAVIVFYHQNPGVRDRIEDLARHLGRREEDVERAVEFLTASALLEKNSDGEETVFSYRPEPALKNQVNLFVNALDIRDLRLWILSEVLGK